MFESLRERKGGKQEDNADEAGQESRTPDTAEADDPGAEPMPEVSEMLGAEGLMEPDPDTDGEDNVGDLPREPLNFPADRDLRLQNLARGDEGVLTGQGVRAVGGRAGIDALNRGQAMGGIIVVPVPIARATRRVMKDEVRRTGPVRTATNREQKRGQRGF